MTRKYFVLAVLVSIISLTAVAYASWFTGVPDHEDDAAEAFLWAHIRQSLRYCSGESL